MRWQELAACKGQTDIMFPERGPNVGYHDAVAFCESCVVLEHCKKYVLTSSQEPYGIWAGMNLKERIAYRKSHGVTGDGVSPNLLLQQDS